MANFNRNPVSAAVNGAFNLTVNNERVSDVLERLAQPMQYEFGLFAEQDIRVLVSAYYTLIYQLISLQPRAADTPLQDMPQEGSLEANDTGVEDTREIERQEMVADCLKGIAYIHRHLMSLDERARKELEEAGQRTVDGGRFRFNLKQKQYRSMVKDFEEVLLDAKAREPLGSTRIGQIDQALMLNLPYVAETDAQTAIFDYLDPERTDRIANRAWDQVLDSLAECSDIIDAYNGRMAELNVELVQVSEAYRGQERKAKLDTVKSQMAMARNQYRQDLNYPQWLLSQRLRPVALLAHTGTPRLLLDSPEWRTKKSEERAAAARAKVSEVQAKTTEIEAKRMELAANQALLEANKALAEQMRLLDEQLGVAKPKAPAKQPKKASKAKADKPAKAKTESPYKGTNVFSTRGKADSFRPRG